nr:6674_t:CDS:2 [Entrophospora candida]
MQSVHPTQSIQQSSSVQSTSTQSTQPMHSLQLSSAAQTPTTIQLPFPPELEPYQTTHSWTIRGFQDLTKLMYNDAFIYSDRFKSPRGINDTCYLNPPQQIWDPASLFNDINDDRDSDYVWRMKMYPNKYQNEISLFLEAIQTPFEKQNYSSKEIPQLVYVSDRFKWNFDLQGVCVSYGAHSIGTFQDLFQERVNNGVGSVDNYDVANNNIDFISDNPNPCPTSSSPSSPSLSSPYTSNPSNIRTIKAHKILLSQRSEYFDSMFKSGYKESTLKRIPIRSTSYEVFYIIISYIYSLKLPDNNDIDHDDNSNNILLSYEILKEIYINADMMRLEHLAKLAAERLSHMVNCDTWDQLLKITWRLNIAPASRLQLKRVILEYVHKNWSLLKATENMKNLIATSSVENIEELMETKMFGVSN